MANILQEKFPLIMSGPLKFDEWIIHGCRYKNLNPTIKVEENSKYVVMQGSMIDKDGYAVLLPLSRDRGTMVLNGMPNVITHWGRVCQFTSPMVGAIRTVLLPMIGCASDSQLYAQFEWTYQVGYERRTIRKVGKIELERLPWTKKVEVYKNGGPATLEEKVGYVWEGTLTVTIEKCEEFDSFVAQTAQSYKKSVTPNSTTPKTTPGDKDTSKNDSNQDPNANVNTNPENDDKITQIYHIEMIIESCEINKDGESDLVNDCENQNENEASKTTNKATNDE